MSRFKIDRPRTIAGESARALLAKMYSEDLTNDGSAIDAYRLAASDVEALNRILGQEDAERALRRAGFIPMHGGYWVTRFRTEKGGDKVMRLLPPYDLLHAIARTYGREEHALTVSFSGTVSCRFGDSSELAA